jgi:hypothetical protein
MGNRPNHSIIMVGVMSLRVIATQLEKLNLDCRELLGYLVNVGRCKLPLLRCYFGMLPSCRAAHDNGRGTSVKHHQCP